MKIIYLYKSVNVNFGIIFKILPKFQELPSGNLNKTYLVNIFFA